MASGRQSLRLTTAVSWSAFPAFAHAVVALLRGSVLEKADTPVERVWTVELDGERFYIAFDDFALGISLDPLTDEAAVRIPQIRQDLLGHRLRLAPSA
jgi:hypothetical protein